MAFFVFETRGVVYVSFIILPQGGRFFAIVFKGCDQLFLLAFICAFLDNLWSIFTHKDYFFPVFPLNYFSDWYFRVLFSLVTLMLLLKKICPPTFCFSSTFYKLVHCRNLSAQRKWWMGSWMSGVIHCMTNHGIFFLCILNVFMCSKSTTLGCQQKPLFL